MFLISRRSRSVAGIAVLSVALGVTGCAALPTDAVAPTQPPTMAPDQSTAEACAISTEQVDQLVLSMEQSITEGIAQARSQVLAGQVPDLNFLQIESDSALEAARDAVTNPEVSAAIDRVFAQFSGFADIAEPETPFGFPGYLSNLTEQISALTKAGNDLAELCGMQPFSTN